MNSYVRNHLRAPSLGMSWMVGGLGRPRLHLVQATARQTCRGNVFARGEGQATGSFFSVTLGHKECLGKPMAVGCQANSHWQLCRGESSQLQHLFQDQIHNLRGIGLE